MNSQETIKMPWSVQQTIEDLKFIKMHYQGIVKAANRDGKGEQDVEEVAFDFDRAIAALEKQEREKWHPIYPDDPKSFPDNDRLILVSFSNAPGIIDIARWRTDLDGGMFCPGDEDYPYTRSGMYVNAWKERPEVYEEDDNE